MYILYKSRKKGNSYYNDIISECKNGKEAYNMMLGEIEKELGYLPEIKVVSELALANDNDKYYYGVDDKFYGIAIDNEYDDVDWYDDCDEEYEEDDAWYPERDNSWCHSQGIM